MKAALIGLLAETSLHPGAGATSGVIDLPVAREVVTGYPVIPGSSLKGALRERAEEEWGNKDPKVEAIFGAPDSAGGLAVTDARLLLLPVRSLTGHFKWVTCAYVLERLQRDGMLAGLPFSGSLTAPSPGHVLAGAPGTLYLEEVSFTVAVADLSVVVATVSSMIPHHSVRSRLGEQLLVCPDDDFAYFARYALQVSARNVLNDDTKTSENLWYEETIPPDTLLYALLVARPGGEGMLDEVRELFARRPYLQVGGNETVGQGWCAVAWHGDGGSSGD